MKNIFLILVVVVQTSTLFAQEEVFVSAKSGLNVRLNPDLDAEKIGTYKYAEKIEVHQKTGKSFEITDNNKTIKGEWYHVKGATDSSEIVTGYVFSGFLTKPYQKDTFQFLNYDDNYDYFTLNAKNGESTYRFINNDTEDRSYLKGDSIEIEWKEDLVHIVDDENTKEIANRIIATKKIKSGTVSNFRKNYNKEIKYYYSDTYSQSYLDDIYLIVEHYMANSSNELIKNAIADKESLAYSIENRRRNNADYLVLGINHSAEFKTATLQWLYYNTENGELYEYDLANDELIEFDY